MADVLVVEDSQTQREAIANILKASGLNVSVAADGREALEKIQQQCPDLVILDVIMPRMNGYELCRKLKSDAKTKHVVVVMCSVMAEEFDRFWGMKQGADAFLAKPLPPQEFAETIKGMLHNKI